MKAFIVMVNALLYRTSLTQSSPMLNCDHWFNATIGRLEGEGALPSSARVAFVALCCCVLPPPQRRRCNRAMGQCCSAPAAKQEGEVRAAAPVPPIRQFDALAEAKAVSRLSLDSHGDVSLEFPSAADVILTLMF